MLVVSGANALGGLGDLSADLRTLQKRVDSCVRAFPLDNSNSGADTSTTCNGVVGGAFGGGLPTFEKLSLVDAADNAVMFTLARTLLTNWRNTASGGTASATEVNVRRIAAQKLGEEPVLEGGPVVQAAQTLASAARIESNDQVKLAIITSLSHLLRTRGENIIPPSVRTEAITSLKLLGDPTVQRNTSVLNAATAALKDLGPSLEIGPITVTSAPTRVSKFKVPLIAAGVTAVVATGALALFLHRRHATGLSAAGPLRRRVEAALRRRRAR